MKKGKNRSSHCSLPVMGMLVGLQEVSSVLMRIFIALPLLIIASMTKAAPIEVLVTRVIDGDTLEVLIPSDTPGWNVHRVRLAGLNTPELASRCTTSSARSKERLLAYKAKAFVEEKINGIVRIDKVGQDSFNRPLVEVWVGDINLNLILLDSGHARPYIQNTRGQQWCFK